MPELGVNIDHVATLRQARRTYEPDPIWAAAEAELGGADGITIHLREDRRHIQDRDLELLRQTVSAKLNLELASASEIVEIACRVKPDQATLGAGAPRRGNDRRGAASTSLAIVKLLPRPLENCATPEFTSACF